MKQGHVDIDAGRAAAIADRVLGDVECGSDTFSFRLEDSGGPLIARATRKGHARERYDSYEYKLTLDPALGDLPAALETWLCAIARAHLRLAERDLAIAPHLGPFGTEPGWSFQVPRVLGTMMRAAGISMADLNATIGSTGVACKGGLRIERVERDGSRLIYGRAVVEDAGRRTLIVSEKGGMTAVTIPQVLPETVTLAILDRHRAGGMTLGDFVSHALLKDALGLPIALVAKEGNSAMITTEWAATETAPEGVDTSWLD